MVGIVTGNELGVDTSSLARLGQGGVQGNPAQGRGGESVYVNAATGNLIVRQRDEVLIGRGPDATLVRTYNSQGILSEDPDAPDLWLPGWGKQVYGLSGTLNAAGSSIARRDAQGALVRYSFDTGVSAYRSALGEGAYDTLRHNAGTNTWTWTKGSTRVHETYAAAGEVWRIVSSVDDWGNRLDYAYDDDGRLRSLSTPAGERLLLDHEGGRLLQVRSENSSGTQSTRTRYGYDAQGRLERVTVDLSPSDNSITDGAVYLTRYAYDGQSTRIAGITQSDGSELAFEYTQGSDGVHRLTRIREDPQGRDRITTLEYDLAARRTTVRDATGQASVLSYDAAGRLLRVQLPAVDGAARTLSYTYYSNGTLSSFTDALGRTSVYTYDANGNRISERDALGNTITREFGPRLGRLQRETVHLVPDPDGAGPKSASEPRSTRYVYDDITYLLLRFTLSAEGNVTEYRYDAYGQVVRTIEYLDARYDLSTLAHTTVPSEPSLKNWAGQRDTTRTRITDMAYDARGQVSSMTRYARVNSRGEGIADGRESRTVYVYGPRGELLHEIDPRSAPGAPVQRTHLYDGLGRLTASVDALGQRTLVSYDDANRRTLSTFANGRVHTRSFDASGALIHETDSTPTSAGQTLVLGETRYAYDAAGRLRARVDADGQVTHFLYDAASRQVGQIDAGGYLTELILDGNDRQVGRVRYANALSAPARASLLDAQGQPITVSLASVRPVAHALDRREWSLFDGAGRLVKQIDAAGALTEHQYDGASRRVRSIAYANAVDLRQVSVATQPGDASVSPSTTPEDRITRYFHDGDGRLTGTLDPEGYLVEQRYDPAGQLVHRIAYARASTPELRASGTLAQLRPSAHDEDQHTRYTYDAAGRQVGEIDPLGYFTAFSYDTAGNLTTRVRHAGAVDTALLSARAATLSLSARTLGAPIRLEVRVDGVAVAGSPLTVSSSTTAEHTLTLNLVVAENHRVDLIFVDGGSDLAVEAISLDGQRIASDSPFAHFDPGTGANATNGIGVTALPARVTDSGALRFVVQGLERLRPASRDEDQRSAYAYDALNRLVREVRPDGLVSTRVYDTAGNLVTHTLAAGSEEARTTTRRYDLLGRIVAELGGEASAQLASLTQAQAIEALWASRATHHHYDSAGRRVASTGPLGQRSVYYYDARGQVTHTVNALGEVVEQRYDAFGQVSETLRYAKRLSAQQTAALGGGLISAEFLEQIATLAGDELRERQGFDAAGRRVTLTDALGYVTQWRYSAFGEEIAHKTPWESGRDIDHTRTYDRRGLLIEQTTDAGGLALRRRMRHDAFGRVIEETDAAGRLTRRTYDRAGRVVEQRDALDQVQRTTYDAFDRVLTLTDRLGQVTTYTYDDAKRSLRVRTPEGITRSSTRNRHGETQSEVDGNGAVTQHHYDRDGRRILTVTPLAVSASRYDAAGPLMESTDALGVVTTYAYDAAGRLVSRTLDPTGLNLTTTWRYDTHGRAVWTRDPVGVWTQTLYDARGQVLATVIDPRRGPDWRTGEDDNPRGLALRTEYTYDRAGNTLDITEAAGTVAARLVRYQYDALGRRLRETVDPAGLNLVTRYTYDAAGNMSSRVDAAGQVTRYYHDANDRLVFTLDALNQLTRHVHDAQGRVVEVRAYASALADLPEAPSLADIAAAVAPATADHVERSVYDRDGRLIHVIDALGHVTTHQYDGNGQSIARTRHAQPISIDGQSTLTQVRELLRADAQTDRTEREVRDAAGRQRYRIDALGYVTQTRYDAAGRIVQTLAHATALPADTEATLLALDALYSTSKPDKTNRVERFEYDAAGRLVRAYDAEGFAEQYSYDAAGNRTSFINKKGARWTYEYDANRRLLSETSPPVAITAVREESGALVSGAGDVTTAALVTRMTYDARGNVLTRTEAHGRPEARTTVYGYDKANRQIRVQSPPVPVYDAAADDLARNGLDGTLARTQTTLTPVTQILHDALGRAVAQRDAAGSVSRKTYDALGRLRHDIDAEGYVTTHDYDRFGNAVRTTRHATALTLSSELTALSAERIAQLLAAQSSAQRADDRTLEQTYDRLDRLIRVTEPTALVYDAATGEAADRARITQNTYNRFGDLIRQEIAGAATYHYYDRRGLKVRSVDALGYVTTQQYDAAGNVVRQVEFARALEAGTWNEAGAADPTSSSDPAADIGQDRVYQYTYDHKNQKLTQTRVGVRFSELTAPLAVQEGRVADVTTRYGYDGLGNVVNVTDGTGATAYTWYDDLGRKIASAEPERQMTSAGISATLPTVRVAPRAAAFDILETQQFKQGAPGYHGSISTWVGRNVVKLTWSSLEDYGAGFARVRVEYKSSGSTGVIEQIYAANLSNHGLDFVWTQGAPAGLDSVQRVRVWKEIDGTEVQVIDCAGPNAAPYVLSFARPRTGLIASVRVAAAGSAQWQTINTRLEGNLQVADLNGLGAGLYDYELTLNSGSEVAARGGGRFQLLGATGPARAEITGFVDTGAVSFTTTTAAVTGSVYQAYMGYRDVWSGRNTITLHGTLDNLQGANLRILIDYLPAYSGRQPMPARRHESIVAWSQARAGITLDLGSEASSGLHSVTRVRVLRAGPAGETLILDRNSAGPGTPRLILQGALSGVSAVNIEGVGTRNLSALGGGVYAVDLSGVARGHYRYSTVTDTPVAGSFDLLDGDTDGATPVIQEKRDVAGWRLQVAHIDAGAGPVTLLYRLTGDSGPWQSKALTYDASAKAWSAYYDDLACARYDVEVRTGGQSQAVLSTGVDITRGGILTQTTQSIAQPVTLTPLTLYGVDAFGQPVMQTRLARGAASVATGGYTLRGGDAADQITLTQRDARGLALRTQDAEGHSTHATYDVLGRIAKEWRPYLDNDGRVQHRITVYRHDRTGRQVEKSELALAPNGALLVNGGARTLEDVTLSFAIASQANYNLWQGSSGSNTAKVNWGDLSAWGTGAERVTVYSNLGEASERFSSGTASATLNLPGGHGPVTSLTRVRVEKQDSAGNWQVVHDRGASTGAYGKVLTLSSSSPGDSIALFYRASGTQDWIAWRSLAPGTRASYDTRILPRGDYEYEALFTRPGDTRPWSYLRGLLQVDGAAIRTTLDNPASSYHQGALPEGAWVRHQTRYNAFGEIIAKGTNEGWQEYYHYDRAGRMWRSNEKDGVAKITLYDAAGNASAQLRSEATDLAQLPDARSALALTPRDQPDVPVAALSWTRTEYDALGRASVQRQAGFSVTGAQATGALRAEALRLDFQLDSAGPHSVARMQWGDLSALGAGRVEVLVDYSRQSYRHNGWGWQSSGDFAPQATLINTLTSQAGTTGANVVLGDHGNPVDYRIDRVRVRKQDAAGQWHTLHDRRAGTPVQHASVLSAPVATPGARASLTVDGAPCALIDFGARLWALSLPEGTHNYRLMQELPGGASTLDTGRYSTSGASLTLTPDAGASALVSPVLRRSHDRWGNVLSLVDARGAVQRWRYNDQDLVIRHQRPQVLVRGVDGVDTLESPTLAHYYDRLGRQIGTREPYSEREAGGAPRPTTYVLDAAGQRVREWHPDGAYIDTVYDALGRQIQRRDARGEVSTLAYDRLDRVLRQMSPTGAIEHYAYDALGNRVRVTDALGAQRRYDFDPLGRLILKREPLGQTQALSYDAQGRKRREVDANGALATWSQDYYGRVLAYSDWGAGRHEHVIDRLTGRVLRHTSTWGQDQRFDYTEDGRLRRIHDVALGALTTYAYDANGKLVRERYERAGAPIRDTRLGYDALDRLVSLDDPRASLRYAYDARDNRRSVFATYLDGNQGARSVQYWCAYDAMNRVILSQGVRVGTGLGLQAGRPGAPAQGVQMAYDGAGNRVQASGYEGERATLLTDTYSYDAQNRLLRTYRGGQATSERRYDGAGRVLSSLRYGQPGEITERREQRYNANGWLLDTRILDAQGRVIQRNTTSAFDALGHTLRYEVSVSAVNTRAYTNTYQTRYLVREAYLESTVQGSSDLLQPGATRSTYDVNGAVQSVTDTQRPEVNREFVTDANGRILQKRQAGRTQHYLYANDAPVGASGEVDAQGALISAADFDFNYSPIEAGDAGAGAGRHIVSTGDTLSSIALSVYGDARLWYLIAQANALRGDESLTAGTLLSVPTHVQNANRADTRALYRPAELVGDTLPYLPPPPPPRGKRGCGALQIIIMIVVMVITAATTGLIAGNVGGSAGGLVGSNAAGWSTLGSMGFSQTVQLGLAAASGQLGSNGVMASMLGRAIGSFVGQGLEMLLGQRETISWREVAGSALGAGAAALVGVSGTGQWAGAGAQTSAGTLIEHGARAGLGNALAQGANVLLGNQQSFDWRALAASAIGAPLGALAQGAARQGMLGSAVLDTGVFNPGAVYAADLGARLLGASVRQGVSVALYGGGKFDWVSVAADAFGNALVEGLAGVTLRAGQQEQALRKAYALLRDARPETVGEAKQEERLRYGFDSEGTGLGLKLTNAVVDGFDQQLARQISSAGAAADLPASAPLLLAGRGDFPVVDGALNGWSQPLSGARSVGGQLLADSVSPQGNADLSNNEIGWSYDPPQSQRGALSAAQRVGLGTVRFIANNVKGIALDLPQTLYSVGDTLLGHDSYNNVLFDVNEFGAALPADGSVGQSQSAPDVWESVKDFAASLYRSSVGGIIDGHRTGNIEKTTESALNTLALGIAATKAGKGIVALGRSSGYSIAINGASRTIPLGFESEAQFFAASRELQAALRMSGIDDAVVGVRGSAVTGVTANPRSGNFGKPFGKDSDIDFFVQSHTLTDNFKTTRDIVYPGPLMKKYPTLQAWSEKWTEILGRDIKPAAWKPGALPKTPAILVLPKR